MKYILFLWLIFLTDRVRCDGDILQNIKPPDYRKKVSRRLGLVNAPESSLKIVAFNRHNLALLFCP